MNSLDELRTLAFSRVKVGDPKECWPWMGHRDAEGYGKVTIKGRKWRAHRLIFFLTWFIEPECVLHKCDNPSCCNPNHLRAGTQEQNMRDRDRKGRGRFGHVLSGAEVKRMVVARERDAKTYRELGEQFGVSTSTAYFAVNGRRKGSG